MTRYDRNYLFSDHDLFLVIENQKTEVNNAIDLVDRDRLLKTDPTKLKEYFIERFLIEVPEPGEAEVTQNESRIDVSQDFDRAINDTSKPFYVSATEFKFYVPFKGDATLFKCKPSAYTLSPPVADLEDGQLIFSYTEENPNADKIKKQFEKDFGQIKWYLDKIKSQVDEFNKGLEDIVKARIDGRRKKLLGNQEIAASMGFKLKQSEGAPKTYSVDLPRKPIPIMPSPGREPYVSEPTLNDENYESILKTITNMVHVIERSPKAFKEMQEEDIRHHFLVQLNAQYEGQATGETFNYEGKTDLLIRVKDRNIFIAECKFWSGPQSLTDTIDQILGYTTWRDTKTAILLFNRNKNLSNVLKQIPDIVKSHAKFKKENGIIDETRFNYVVSHKDDPNREIKLSILVFEIPK